MPAFEPTTEDRATVERVAAFGLTNTDMCHFVTNPSAGKSIDRRRCGRPAAPAHASGQEAAAPPTSGMKSRRFIRSPRRRGRAGCQDFETERAGSIFFRPHGTILPPVGVESGLAAYSTGPTQNRTRTSRSRSIEPSRCSCMPPLGSSLSVP
jgi:hypothetical protein